MNKMKFVWEGKARKQGEFDVYLENKGIVTVEVNSSSRNLEQLNGKRVRLTLEEI